MFRLLFSIVVILAANAELFPQTVPTAPSPEPSPAAKPVVKRRAFDQFDLSSGVFSGPSSSSALAVTEPVDRQTYDGIARMVKYASQIESEYRSTDGVVVDPSDHFEPYRVLSRKLPAIYRIVEMFRAGLLEQPALTHTSNVSLLEDNQRMIGEMQMIVNSSDAQLARNQTKLLQIAERYGAPTDPVEKRPLLNAMFARLNGNFSRLLNQVVVRNK